MRKTISCCAIVTVVLIGLLASRTAVKAQAADATEPMFVHNVFFSLKDNSTEAKNAMLAACKKYLTKHEGEVFFAAGTLCDERKLRGNDRDFDIHVLIVFQRQADIATFDKSERHGQFGAEHRANWKKVRIFDTLAEK